MSLTIIVAVSENNVIGRGNEIPWHISEDLKRFKELTLDHPVIMGRNTYESIPPKFRPLPKRKNIVLSRTLEETEGVYVARDMKEALGLTEGKDTYIMGGSRVYEAFLPLSDRIELTHIHQEVEGDVYFPEVNWDDWNLLSEERHTSEEGIRFSFLSYARIVLIG